VTSSETKRACIYSRVSSEEQASGDKTSLQSQQEHCRQVCASSGWGIVGEFSDPGVSGTLFEQRPGLQAALALAREGAYDVLVCYLPDRLSRDLLVSEIIKRDLREAGVIWLHAGRLMDLTDVTDVFAGQVLDSAAQFAKTSQLERMYQGKVAAAKRGKLSSPGASALFGYRRVKIDGEPLRYEVNEAEAVIVRQVFDRYTEDGWSIRRIAETLNQGTVPSPGTARASGGGKWHPGNLHRLLRNQAYKGELQHRFQWKRRAEMVTVPVPALVTPEQWDRAQSRRKTNKLERGKKERFYLLRNMVQCGSCGLPMRAHTHERGKPRYRCSMTQRIPSLRKPCDGPPSVLCGDVDRYVWLQVRDWLSSGDTLSALVDHERRAAQEQPVDDESELRQTVRVLETLPQQRQNVLTLARRGVVELDEATEQLDALKREAAELEQRRQDLERRLSDSTYRQQRGQVLSERLQSLASVVAFASGEQQRKLLQALSVAVTIPESYPERAPIIEGVLAARADGAEEVHPMSRTSWGQ
jgi:site-specific DNA recombinase